MPISVDGMPKNLQGLVMDLAFKGVIELVKNAEDRSIAWNEGGDIRAAATFTLLPEHPIRVEVVKRRNGHISVQFPPVKVIKGQAKRKRPGR
ncbi:hypothetical protein [Streptomyces galbus]|uniref:Uncharacterized protein n=1 Tax=Streptomyces galbus TaxID=33898 RepID=A0A4U5WXA9_STRGB|nr:hypothetical protein [Streptomyces galbus]TKT07197.1 hypothetical protein E4U92_25450 [Streptomyces galbus]GHD33991.1 hypothetical protein GCM10010335_27390 [Streptomyces galbus]